MFTIFVEVFGMIGWLVGCLCVCSVQLYGNSVIAVSCFNVCFSMSQGRRSQSWPLLFRVDEGQMRDESDRMDRQTILSKVPFFGDDELLFLVRVLRIDNKSAFVRCISKLLNSSTAS